MTLWTGLKKSLKKSQIRKK